MLKGKIAIITGGTRGIGFGTAKAYLENGAKVALCGSRPETVEKALTQLKALNPAYEVVGYHPDLADKVQIKEMVDAVVAQWGRIDILINNAGITADKSIYDYGEEDFARLMAINVQAMYNCTKAVVTTMRAQKGGVVLNTSSLVSFYGGKNQSGYATSKFAVNGLTKSLARELGPDGIRVNAVAPGVIETDMVKALDERLVKQLTAVVPLGRMGQAEDIAKAYVFLGSDMASYISGAVLPVDGAIVL